MAACVFCVFLCAPSFAPVFNSLTQQTHKTKQKQPKNSKQGYLGTLELWEKAEAALEEALNSTGREWVMNPGDGAFYGPKIDITVYDALRRKFQCATVQLDFQLPIR